MLSAEDIRKHVLQFSEGDLAFVATGGQVFLAARDTDEPLKAIHAEALLHFLEELPDLVGDEGEPFWVGIHYGEHTLFIHPRPQEDVWIGLWVRGGLENFSSFEAFVRERTPDLLQVLRERLIEDFRGVLQCVLFFRDRLAHRWGKPLIYLLFWRSLSPELRRLFRQVRQRHPSPSSSGTEGLSRQALERELDQALDRFLSRLERAWGKGALNRAIQYAFRHPHPDRPSGCVLQRLQRIFSSLQR